MIFSGLIVHQCIHSVDFCIWIHFADFYPTELFDCKGTKEGDSRDQDSPYVWPNAIHVNGQVTIPVLAIKIGWQWRQQHKLLVYGLGRTWRTRSFISYLKSTDCISWTACRKNASIFSLILFSFMVFLRVWQLFCKGIGSKCYQYCLEILICKLLSSHTILC